MTDRLPRSECHSWPLRAGLVGDRRPHGNPGTPSGLVAESEHLDLQDVCGLQMFGVVNPS